MFWLKYEKLSSAEYQIKIIDVNIKKLQEEYRFQLLQYTNLFVIV
jgi:hypothetical protein